MFLFFSSSFRTLRKVWHKTQMHVPIRQNYGTHKVLIKADLSTNFGRNPMKIHGVMIDYLRKMSLSHTQGKPLEGMS